MKRIIIFFLFTMYLTGGCSQAEETIRPNILYVMTDQQSHDAMSCAGNENVHTPALDRLASRGIRFENAYCAFPLCVPSRAAMFTGRMPHEAGIFSNTRPVQDEELPFITLGKLLRNRGYTTHYIGKWHLTIPMKDTLQHGFTGIGHQGAHGFDSEHARQAVEFLNEKHEDPFFLVVSFVNPHDACQLARGEDLSLWEGPIPELPGPGQVPALPANFEIPENEPDFLREWQKEKSDGAYPSYFWNEQEFREYQWGYYRLVEKVDSLLALVFDAASSPSLKENTLIIFSSDHGDGSSRHRWNQKISPYDESARVPFIIAGSSVSRKGESESKLVSAGLDLLPTICDLAGVKPPAGLQGRSLLPLLSDKQDLEEWRKYVVTEISFGSWTDQYHLDTFPRARMVRTDDYKYIVYDKGNLKEQLIDMKNDPGEMHNLAIDPEYREVLDLHRAYLEEWIDLTNDSFTIPPG